MLPELDSMTVVSGPTSPEAMACEMMVAADLSFMLPPGLNDSSLT
jgi:hypothetical protein